MIFKKKNSTANVVQSRKEKSNLYIVRTQNFFWNTLKDKLYYYNYYYKKQKIVQLFDRHKKRIIVQSLLTTIHVDIQYYLLRKY